MIVIIFIEGENLQSPKSVVQLGPVNKLLEKGCSYEMLKTRVFAVANYGRS